MILGTGHRSWEQSSAYRRLAVLGHCTLMLGMHSSSLGNRIPVQKVEAGD